MNKISETDKAYLAGLIDGEGCIAIMANRNKDHTQHSLRLIISSVDKSVLESLMGRYSVGFIYVDKRNNRNDNWRMVYYWATSTNDAVNLLKLVYPYLKIKKEQADIAVQFQSTMRKRSEIKGSGRGGLGCKTPQDLIDQREQYRQALTELKGYRTKRGRPPYKNAILVDE